jgi:hypothetical protein
MVRQGGGYVLLIISLIAEAERPEGFERRRGRLFERDIELLYDR